MSIRLVDLSIQSHPLSFFPASQLRPFIQRQVLPLLISSTTLFPLFAVWHLIKECLFLPTTSSSPHLPKSAIQNLNTYQKPKAHSAHFIKHAAPHPTLHLLSSRHRPPRGLSNLRSQRLAMERQAQTLRHRQPPSHPLEQATHLRRFGHRAYCSVIKKGG